MPSEVSQGHSARLSRMSQGFAAALDRFVARLEQAGDGGEVEPPNGRWSPAQIAYHVSLVNHAFAGLMDGTIKGTQPADPGFVERDWTAIAASLARTLTAPERTRPPAGATMADALTRLRVSGARVLEAIARLTPERGGLMLKSPIVGEISVYQIGDWAIAHVIRHNAQVKRILEAGGQRPGARARGPGA